MVVFGMYLVYIMGGIRSVGDPALFFTKKRGGKEIIIETNYSFNLDIGWLNKIK
jgi:hypothetical protein